MGFRIKLATVLSVIVFVSFALELISVLSVPVTHKIALCSYDGILFGVFGYCSIDSGECSSFGIGYDIPSGNDGFSLPSNARKSLSNLLIVHVVAAGLSFLLFLLVLVAHFERPANSTRYLLFMLLLTLPTFVMSLLAFLVDILLFVSHLGWAGWIVLAATVLIAFCGVLIWVTHRRLSSQVEGTFIDHSEINTFTQNNDPFGNDSTASFSNILTKHSDDTSVRHTTNGSIPEEVPLTHIGDQSLNSLGEYNDSNINATNRTPSPSADYRYGRTGYYTASGNMPGNDQYPYTNASPLPEGRRVAPIPAGSYIPGRENENINMGMAQQQRRPYRPQYGENPQNNFPPRMRSAYTGPPGGPLGNGPSPNQPYRAYNGRLSADMQASSSPSRFHAMSSSVDQSNEGDVHNNLLSDGSNDITPHDITSQDISSVDILQKGPTLPNVGDPTEFEEQEESHQHSGSMELQQPAEPDLQQPTLDNSLQYGTTTSVDAAAFAHNSSKPHQQLRQYFVDGNEEDSNMIGHGGSPLRRSVGSDSGPVAPPHKFSYNPEAQRNYMPNQSLPAPPIQGRLSPRNNDQMHMQGRLSPRNNDQMPMAYDSRPPSDVDRYETPSESSHYTSISEREARRQQGPTRSEFALQNNPDFQVTRLPANSRNGNKNKRPPPAFAANDGPYGMINR